MHLMPANVTYYDDAHIYPKTQRIEGLCTKCNTEIYDVEVHEDVPSRESIHKTLRQ